MIYFPFRLYLLLIEGHAVIVQDKASFCYWRRRLPVEGQVCGGDAEQADKQAAPLRIFYHSPHLHSLRLANSTCPLPARAEHDTQTPDASLFAPSRLCQIGVQTLHSLHLGMRSYRRGKIPGFFRDESAIVNPLFSVICLSFIDHHTCAFRNHSRTTCAQTFINECNCTVIVV